MAHKPHSPRTRKLSAERLISKIRFPRRACLLTLWTARLTKPLQMHQGRIAVFLARLSVVKANAGGGGGGANGIAVGGCAHVHVWLFVQRITSRCLPNLQVSSQSFWQHSGCY